MTQEEIDSEGMGEDDNVCHVLVVEDEPSYWEALQIGLTREGFNVSVATDGLAGLEMFRKINPDIVLLDIMLPKLSGVDVCRKIRAESNVPIIMVTAKSSEIDTVVGLEVGADDYVTKPYRLRELVARMRAVLRRKTTVLPADNMEITARSKSISDNIFGEYPTGQTQKSSEANRRPVLSPADTLAESLGLDLSADDEIHIGEVNVNISRHEVWVRGELVPMPRKEFELLTVLMENVSRVLTREVLIHRVWGIDYVGDTKTLDVHIKRIRAKIEVDASTPRLIQTVRGVGYKFLETK